MLIDGHPSGLALALLGESRFIDGFVEKVAAMREVVGPKFDLGIEMHADHSPQVAMETRCLLLPRLTA